MNDVAGFDDRGHRIRHAGGDPTQAMPEAQILLSRLREAGQQLNAATSQAAALAMRIYGDGDHSGQVTNLKAQAKPAGLNGEMSEVISDIESDLQRLHAQLATLTRFI